MQTYAVNTIRSRLVILSAHLPMNEDSVNLVGNGFQKNEHWKKRNFERASDEGFFYWVLSRCCPDRVASAAAIPDEANCSWLHQSHHCENMRQAIIFSNDDPHFQMYISAPKIVNLLVAQILISMAVLTEPLIFFHVEWGAILGDCFT